MLCCRYRQGIQVVFMPHGSIGEIDSNAILTAVLNGIDFTNTAVWHAMQSDYQCNLIVLVKAMQSDYQFPCIDYQFPCIDYCFLCRCCVDGSGNYHHDSRRKAHLQMRYATPLSHMLSSFPYAHSLEL